MTAEARDPDGVSAFAAAAEALRAKVSPRNPRLREAEQLLRDNRLGEAHEALSRFLEKRAADAMALYLMAETQIRLDRREDAEALFAQCVRLAPDFTPARYSYASTLAQLNRPEAALAQVERLLSSDARNPLYRNLKAQVLSGMGDHAWALQVYRGVAEDFPHSPDAWIEYGSALRSAGQRKQSIDAYRKAIELRPAAGGAYWRLANVREHNFADAELAQMQSQLARADVSGDDRMYLHYALGRALGDRGEYKSSFENYARANAIERAGIDYDPDGLTNHVRDSKALFTSGFFEARAGTGCDAPGPIFIVGMQRAGSTLIEQILACHSAVEATAELPNISLLAEHIGEKLAPERRSRYPEVLAQLDAATLRSFGAQYLENTRAQRKLGRPFFTDKMPYNFLHLGLIHLILPNAKIIDARRHPLGCCFSNFSMHFKSGALFGCRLSELGRAYSDYVALMAHFDSVLPGRVHRVFYEELVAAPETEIAKLLSYLELPFEEGCLAFHKSNRAMDSASSEQVRQPLYSDAVDRWRHYEPWLGPLKTALGNVLDEYPVASKSLR